MDPVVGEVRRRAAQELLARRRARTNFLAFFRYVWWMPHRLAVGRHTRKICAALDQALEDYLAGKSTFLDIRVPFRHGKSDLVSRAFVPYFLARCFMAKQGLAAGEGKDPDVIMSGYGASLVEGFSKDAKGIIRSQRFKAVFPMVQLERGRDNVQEWKLAGSAGKVTASGLGGSQTGKGADLLILDDHTKNRAEARSEVYRQKNWEHFTQGLMTRRAPVSIVIVVATPWSPDDIQGRIRKAMGEDPAFPRFQTISFPARNSGQAREIFGPYLFPERFPPEWYESQYAMLKKWASGLLDCEPVQEGGNRFAVDLVRVHEDTTDFPKARFIRCWDLASSEKERDKDDPDSTVGVLGTVTSTTRNIGGMHVPVHEIWLKHIAVYQGEAPGRDAVIQSTALGDGRGVAQYVEAFGGYKDAYTTLKRVLAGIQMVYPSRMTGDKAAKAAPLEPVFDIGGVHIVRGPWLDAFLKQFTEFPDGNHDDFVDPVAILFHEFTKPRAGLAARGMNAASGPETKGKVDHGSS